MTDEEQMVILETPDSIEKAARKRMRRRKQILEEEFCNGKYSGSNQPAGWNNYM